MGKADDAKRQDDFTGYIQRETGLSFETCLSIYNQMKFYWTYSNCDVNKTILENISSIKIDEVGKNALMVICQGTRTITNKIPTQARKELMEAVKKGFLCRIMKGKKTFEYEVFCKPSLKKQALRQRELNAIEKCKNIAKVFS